MMRVIESELYMPVFAPPELRLYTRRDVYADGSYKEYSYVGPAAEVYALADRCLDVDLEKVDTLLRTGFSFEDALKELGVP